MLTFMQRVFLAAICLCVVGSTVGCSLIGYAVGGAIDPTKFALDSVSVRMEVDSAGLKHRSWDIEHLASLMKEVPPGKGSFVEVQTEKGSFKGNALSLDTVAAVKGEAADTGSEWLLPGEIVTLTTKVTKAKGTVVHLSERNILLRVDGEDRGYALTWVDTISLSDGRVLSRGDFALPNVSGRFIRVPGLLLGRNSYPIFVPLREVESIRVACPVARWGVARTICVVVGEIFDVIGSYSSIREGDSFGVGAFILALDGSFWAVWALTR